jgi:hypothetical protein
VGAVIDALREAALDQPAFARSTTP